MPIVQKWMMILGGLGALYLVVVNPEGFYKATSGIRSLTAGSITDVVTGGKGRTP